MAEEPRAFVVMPGQGRLLDLGGFEMRVKADGGNTDGVVSVLEARDPEEALRRACAAGAVAASRPGAQPSLPTADEVDEILRA